MLFDTDMIVQMAQVVTVAVMTLSASLLLRYSATEPEDKTTDIKIREHVNIPMSGIGSKFAGILTSTPVSNHTILGASERLDSDSRVFVTCDDYVDDINVISF